jgi:dienelactone hydrolase
MNSGDTLSHYRIAALVGAGGMGEVYKAEDTRLKRPVAIKLLAPALSDNADAKQRLIVEAQAASALDHPNICTIYEIDETPDGRLFLAMAFYEGETLGKRIARGALPVAEAIDIVIQAARAVATAHQAGIIHRDIKPANIFLCARSVPRPQDETAVNAHATARHTDESGPVKLLDFGIAKLTDQTGVTRTGSTVGTAPYMAPEHIAGHAIDERADVWSLGVVLYELVTGKRPFGGDNALAIMRSITEDEPPLPGILRSDVPPALDAIVGHALQKRTSDRYASANDLLNDLEALRASLRATATTTVAHAAAASSASNRRALVVAAAAILIIAAAGGWWLRASTRARETQAAVAEIRRLIDGEDFAGAYLRALKLPPDIAADPAVEKLRQDFFPLATVHTIPEGADIYLKAYDEPSGDWVLLGHTPITSRGSMGPFRFRVVKPGYDTFEGGGTGGIVGDVSFALAATGTMPENAARVPGGPLPGGAGRIPDFLIDRFEVTNRAFKQFVDAGGYRDRAYWEEAFVKDGRTITWEEAVAEFRDATGRPGPSTWELGTYPEGKEEWPVGGISWYEAAAYAKFAGRALPTVHHWRMAASQSVHSQILNWSNFSGKSPARVGEFLGLGPYGTYDMAGNVKEWCTNEVGDRRYILGGGWNEPNYQYRQADARLPFDRSANNGMRLIMLADRAAVPQAAYAPEPQLTRDYNKEKPVTDEVFAAYRGLFSYDKTDLAAKVESSEESEAWRVERVTYAAAYGGERIPAYLYLPKNAAPPYQTVLYFPHSGGTMVNSFQQGEMAYLAFLIKAGRALLFPMYKGMYERRPPQPPSGPNAVRDLVIQQVKDLRRSFDYLQTRPDIVADKIAFFGVSLGGNRSSIILAVEPRFKTAVLWSGGLPLNSYVPEVDPINYATRVKTPIILLNGRDDFTFPIETSQQPLYRLLGTPEADKAHKLYDGGHVFPFSRMIKDSLDWLDKYLGTP